MLTKGLQHVAIITKDTDRFLAFYREVFDVIVVKDGAKILHGEGPWLSIIEIGEFSDIWVCEIEGNTEADRQTPLFGRGRIDHLPLSAASLEAFEEIRSRRRPGRPPPCRHAGGSILLRPTIDGTVQACRKEYRGTQSDR